jgi:hypothetical protein
MTTMMVYIHGRGKQPVEQVDERPQEAEIRGVEGLLHYCTVIRKILHEIVEYFDVTLREKSTAR